MAEQLNLTAREVQQIFAEILSHGEDITWDLLLPEQKDVLNSKVSQIFGRQFGAPSMSYLKLTEFVWAQRKYTNGQSLSSLFFVLVVNDVTAMNLAEQSRSWSIHPVFRCRRCVADNSGGHSSSRDCCMIYVDHSGCYDDWDTYLKRTSLARGIMVTCDRGIYKLIDGQVELKTYSVKEPLVKRWNLTSESLTASLETCVVHRLYSKQSDKYVLRVNEVDTIRPSDNVLYLLLKRLEGQKVDNLNARLLSESLVLFTHSVNNFRLASEMTTNATYRSALSSQIQNIYDKISEETKPIEASTQSRLDLIRSANDMPTKMELQQLFKGRGIPICLSNPKLPAEPSTVPPNQSLQIRSINVKGEDIQLADYGEAIIEHISSAESFEDLISSMAEYWKPDMCKLMLQMTQTFMESTRKEFWLLLKCNYSTESVLFRIIRQTQKHSSSLNYNKVSNAIPDILRSVRCYFASRSPNCPPEFLIKCSKCVGYYDNGNRNVDDSSDN